jgi:hypothetical protein
MNISDTIDGARRAFEIAGRAAVSFGSAATSRDTRQ